MGPGENAGERRVTPTLAGRLSAEVILASLGHAVIFTDLAGVVEHWNPAAERLYGWTSAEAVGRNIATLTVPRMTLSLADEIMNALRAGGTWSGGFTVQRKDGVTFPALVTDSAVRDSCGDLVGIIGVSIDLGHALRPLLAHSSDAALVLTADGGVAYVTPSATELFGWGDRSPLGTPVWDLLHPDDRAAAVALHRKVTAATDPVPALECRVRRDDGSFCWVDLLLSNFLDDPAVRGLACNLRDVTERRADRDKLARLADQLQAALTSRVVIEQAKGILVGRTGTDLDSAFAVLRRYARDHNQKLQDVARAIVDGTISLRA